MGKTVQTSPKLVRTTSVWSWAGTNLATSISQHFFRSWNIVFVFWGRWKTPRLKKSRIPIRKRRRKTKKMQFFGASINQNCSGICIGQECSKENCPEKRSFVSTFPPTWICRFWLLLENFWQKIAPSPPLQLSGNQTFFRSEGGCQKRVGGNRRVSLSGFGAGRKDIVLAMPQRRISRETYFWQDFWSFSLPALVVTSLLPTQKESYVKFHVPNYVFCFRESNKNGMRAKWYRTKHLYFFFSQLWVRGGKQHCG